MEGDDRDALGQFISSLAGKDGRVRTFAPVFAIVSDFRRFLMAKDGHGGCVRIDDSIVEKPQTFEQFGSQLVVCCFQTAKIGLLEAPKKSP